MLATHIPNYLRTAIVTAALALVACQSAPVQEMSDARQAISVASKAGAGQHAAGQLKMAQSYLQSAEQMLNERRYSQARQDALSAKNSAIEALRVTESSIDVDAR